MKKILMVVVAVASVSAWLLQGWLVDLARLAMRLSRPAAALRDADPIHQPTTDSPPGQVMPDVDVNRVGSR